MEVRGILASRWLGFDVSGCPATTLDIVEVLMEAEMGARMAATEDAKEKVKIAAELGWLAQRMHMRPV